MQDPAWWRRSNVLIAAMASVDDIKGLLAAYQYQCALVGNPNLTDDSFKAAKDSARDLFYSVLNVIHPWSAKNAEDVKHAEIQGLIDLYKREVGDPDNPEFRAKLEADLAASRAKRMAAESQRPESDEERLERLLRERNLRRDA